MAATISMSAPLACDGAEEVAADAAEAVDAHADGHCGAPRFDDARLLGRTLADRGAPSAAPGSGRPAPAARCAAEVRSASSTRAATSRSPRSAGRPRPGAGVRGRAASAPPTARPARPPSRRARAAAARRQRHPGGQRQQRQPVAALPADAGGPASSRADGEGQPAPSGAALVRDEHGGAGGGEQRPGDRRAAGQRGGRQRRPGAATTRGDLAAPGADEVDELGGGLPARAASRAR